MLNIETADLPVAPYLMAIGEHNPWKGFMVYSCNGAKFKMGLTAVAKEDVRKSTRAAVDSDQIPKADSCATGRVGIPLCSSLNVPVVLRLKQL